MCDGGLFLNLGAAWRWSDASHLCSWVQHGGGGVFDCLKMKPGSKVACGCARVQHGVWCAIAGRCSHTVEAVVVAVCGRMWVQPGVGCLIAFEYNLQLWRLLACQGVGPNKCHQQPWRWLLALLMLLYHVTSVTACGILLQPARCARSSVATALPAPDSWHTAAIIYAWHVCGRTLHTHIVRCLRGCVGLKWEQMRAAGHRMHSVAVASHHCFHGACGKCLQGRSCTFAWVWVLWGTARQLQHCCPGRTGVHAV